MSNPNDIDHVSPPSTPTNLLPLYSRHIEKTQLPRQKGTQMCQDSSHPGQVTSSSPQDVPETAGCLIDKTTPIDDTSVAAHSSVDCLMSKKLLSKDKEPQISPIFRQDDDTYEHVIGKRKKTRRKKRRGPSRPLSAYNYFFSQERKRIIEEHLAQHGHSGEVQNKVSGRQASRQTIPFLDMAKMISSRWQQMSGEELTPYKEMAQCDLERYRREMNEFRCKVTDDAADKRPSTEGAHKSPSWRNSKFAASSPSSMLSKSRGYLEYQSSDEARINTGTAGEMTSLGQNFERGATPEDANQYHEYNSKKPSQNGMIFPFVPRESHLCERSSLLKPVQSGFDNLKQGLVHEAERGLAYRRDPEDNSISEGRANLNYLLDNLAVQNCLARGSSLQHDLTGGTSFREREVILGALQEQPFSVEGGPTPPTPGSLPLLDPLLRLGARNIPNGLSTLERQIIRAASLDREQQWLTTAFQRLQGRQLASCSGGILSLGRLDQREPSCTIAMPFPESMMQLHLTNRQLEAVQDIGSASAALNPRRGPGIDEPFNLMGRNLHGGECVHSNKSSSAYFPSTAANSIQEFSDTYRGNVVEDLHRTVARNAYGTTNNDDLLAAALVSPLLRQSFDIRSLLLESPRTGSLQPLLKLQGHNAAASTHQQGYGR